MVWLQTDIEGPLNKQISKLGREPIGSRKTTEFQNQYWGNKYPLPEKLSTETEGIIFHSWKLVLKFVAVELGNGNSAQILSLNAFEMKHKL